MTTLRQINVPEPLLLEEVEFFKFQLNLFIPKSGLNEGQKDVLIYYYLYENPITKLVQDKRFKSEQSCNNYVTYLRKKGFLVGKGKETKVNPKIKFVGSDFQVKLTIRKDAAT